MSDQTPATHGVRPGEREEKVLMLPPVDWRARHEELRAARIKRLAVPAEDAE